MNTASIFQDSSKFTFRKSLYLELPVTSKQFVSYVTDRDSGRYLWLTQDSSVFIGHGEIYRCHRVTGYKISRVVMFSLASSLCIGVCVFLSTKST